MRATTAETAYHQALQAHFDCAERVRRSLSGLDTTDLDETLLAAQEAVRALNATSQRVTAAKEALDQEHRELLISLGINPDA